MLLTIGTIIIIDKDFTGESEKYKSKVIDIADDHVMIDYPTHMETGKTAFFIDGTKLLVNFTDKRKMSYAYRSEVSGRMMQEVPMLKLTYPGDDQLIKIQRREFVRVDTAIDVAVFNGQEKSQYIAEDISAGGIALRVPESPPFETNATLSLVIVLPFMNKEIKYIYVDATVVRIWEKSGRKIASLQFEDVSMEDRQRIVRFSFEKQLEMRNKS
ncbi:flagellar brake protein [Sporosarcina sp. CAU 1771]